MGFFKVLFPSAAILSVFGLAACGSVDHDPPKLKSVFGTVSSTDTLVAVFDKSLDDFSDSMVTSNVPVTVVKQAKSKIYIVGATDTVAGIPRFEPSSENDTLVFTGIRDDDGNRAKVQTVTFSTYPFLDSDEYEMDKDGNCRSNKTPKNAELLADSSRFFNGVKFSKGVTVTGILAGRYSKQCEDDADTYRIVLQKYDTVSVVLDGFSSESPLLLAVLGPSKRKGSPSFCTEDNLEFLSVDAGERKKVAAIDTTFGVGDIHECGTATITDNLSYYIQVRFSENLKTKDQKPVPYKLTVSIKQHR